MATPTRAGSGCYLAFAAPCLLAAQLCSAHETLYVTNDGSDAGNCGARPIPCRSISQAIENASPGDTILVGAGRYGNISGDSTFSHPGDEHRRIVNGITESTGCMICIDKPLSIYSLHGSSVTVIDGPLSTDYPVNVLVMSYNVHFGGAGAGFAVTGGNTYGVRVDQNIFNLPQLHAPGVNISVSGNTDIGDGTGFSFQGIMFQDDLCNAPPPTYCALPAPIVFSHNEASGNGNTAFDVLLNSQPQIGGGTVELLDNVARGSGTGFSVYPGFQDEIGEAFYAGNVSLIGNVALHNDVGYYLDAAGLIKNNTAAANDHAGFIVIPWNSDFDGNSSLGNAGPGMVVSFSVDWFDGGTDPSRHFHSLARNNFYGNDRARPSLIIAVAESQVNTGPGAHCGILNVGAVATVFGPAQTKPPPQEVIHTADDFWGAATGPASTGVADAVGGACDQNGGVTTAEKPYAAQPFGITTSP